MNQKLKILITGPVPPPAGGVSIHILRLMHFLKKDFDFDLVDESPLKKEGIYNLRSFQIFTYFKKVAKADLMFIHSGNMFIKKIHILTGKLFSKKIIITLHGYGHIRKIPFLYFDNFIFSLADKIILVNPNIGDQLSLPKHKCVVKHAFLPPVLEDEPALPESVNQWLNKEKERVIVCANASRLNMFKNQDLYGLDMSIEVTRRLIAKGLPVSFIFTVSSLENGHDIFEKNLRLIRELKLQDHFLLINERLSFVKLIEKTDIVLRPTNTDGDALTIREAIFLGKNTLASDVVERPAGTLLFKTRDNDDLEIELEKIVCAGKSNTGHSATVKQIEKEDFITFYIDLINNTVKK